ncbi:MAG: hypothetical protein HY033_01595 [Ignavibacteriae bacterium]|nr:hypothetical protein [Ignavibacteria bacterium]MBI3363580.1 hypothetical protein [Ignavibacteriota bacterium]
MHRYLLLMMMLLVASSTWVIAQQDEDEEPLPPPRRAMGPKIGGAAGFTQNILFFDMGPINDVLISANAAPFEGNGLLMLGGQGYGYILLLPNLRIGGMGASGTRKSTSVELQQSGFDIRRDVELSVGYGGVTIDYVIPVMPRLDLAAGILLGSGGMSFKMTRDDGTQKVWNGLWNEFGNSGPNGPFNYSRTLSGSFFIYQPTVNVEFALLRWLGLRVGGSYLGMAGSNWKVDDTYDLFGVPDKISGKGWMINGGIFVGTFVF